MQINKINTVLKTLILLLPMTAFSDTGSHCMSRACKAECFKMAKSDSECSAVANQKSNSKAKAIACACHHKNS